MWGTDGSADTETHGDVHQAVREAFKAAQDHRRCVAAAKAGRHCDLLLHWQNLMFYHTNRHLV